MNRKVIAFAVSIIMCISFFSFLISAEEEVYFVEQPKGGVCTNWHDFEITFKTNVECDTYMLQSRQDETWDWGNIDFIHDHRYVLNTFNSNEQYRIMAYSSVYDKDYYSDVFVITFKPLDDITTVEIKDIRFDSVELGYTETVTVPVVIKNTGKYDLINPVLFLSEESILVLTENKTPTNIKAGETDSTTWSVTYRKGLGENFYWDSVFLIADNIDSDGYLHNEITLEVKNTGNVPLEYSISVNDIDFGNLEEDYAVPDSADLTITNTGSGRLNNIHLLLEGQDTFFRIKSNTASVSYLDPGFSTSNWYVDMMPGVQPGNYEGTIKVFADELEEPATFTVRAVVSGEAQNPSQGNNSGENNSGSNTDSNTWIWILVPSIAIAVAIVLTAAVIMSKNGKNKKEQ